MSFQRMTDDVEIISKLSDEPNETDGLTAAQLKAKFDEAAKLLKTAHNNLVDAMNAVTAAASIGFDSEAIEGETVKAALENLRSDLVTQLQNITQGGVAEKGIKTNMLDDDAVTGAKVAEGTLLEDVTAAAGLTLERADGTAAADVENHLKLYYSRALGMVFVKGYIFVVASATNVNVIYRFSKYAPSGNDAGGALHGSTNMVAWVDNENYPGRLIVSENVTSSWIGQGFGMSVFGWYFCDEEGA